MSSLRRWLEDASRILERIWQREEAFRTRTAAMPPTTGRAHGHVAAPGFTFAVAADERLLAEDQIAAAREALPPATFTDFLPPNAIPPAPYELIQEALRVPYREDYFPFVPAAMVGYDFPPFPAEAEERAWGLLREHLDAEQRESLEKRQSFTVQGSRGGRYRIRVNAAFNVDELTPDGEPYVRLCVVPSEPVPRGDQLLAQMLLLQADEARFWSIANTDPGDAWDQLILCCGYSLDTPPWDREKATLQMKERLEERRAAQEGAHIERAIVAREAAAATRAMTEAINQAARRMDEDMARWAAMIDRPEQ